MAEHSLAIHRFQTRFALTGLREDGPRLSREIGRAVREHLTAAIARVLEPLLGNHDGVLRIDRIALTLGLGRGEVSALRLADLLAREIARAVAERAEVGSAAPHIGAEIAFWYDHDSFAAAYLAHRLRLVPAADWAFPDFRPLAQLAPHEAAVELVAARPEILAALARLLGAARAPALAASLPERTAALLIERLVTGLPAALPAGAAAELAAMIAALPAKSESGPARAAIIAAATALSTPAAASAESVRKVAMLARLAVALVFAPAALEHLPEAARRLAQAALTPLTEAEPVRTTLARVLNRAHRRADAAGVAGTRAAEAIASRVAGIGLLMPAALAHDLPERLSRAALHRTLAAALGPEAIGAVRLDPLLAAFVPFDPSEVDDSFPPVPAALRATVPASRREGEAEDEGAAGWAACLIHGFAAGLSGFEASSLGYLRRQFLARPGTLHIAEGRLTLALDPLPLGILLRLSGIHGWAGRLPQARNALLRIEIRES